jgi:hypothetical protein
MYFIENNTHFRPLTSDEVPSLYLDLCALVFITLALSVTLTLPSDFYYSPLFEATVPLA